VLGIDAEQMLVESCLTSKERREREHYLVTDTTDLRPVHLVLTQNIMVYGQGFKALRQSKFQITTSSSEGCAKREKIC